VFWDLTWSTLEIPRDLRWRRLTNPLLLLGGQREDALKTLRRLLRRERRLLLRSGLGGQRPVEKGIQIRVECFLHSSLDAAALPSIPLRAMEGDLIRAFHLILDHEPPPPPP
jgi:hypothetical protein